MLKQGNQKVKVVHKVHRSFTIIPGFISMLCPVENSGRRLQKTSSPVEKRTKAKERVNSLPCGNLMYFDMPLVAIYGLRFKIDADMGEKRGIPKKIRK